MTNRTPNTIPDELAGGRAEFLRLCAALCAGRPDGIANVMAELSVLHPAAWQLTLQAAAREHVSALGVMTGLEPADLAGFLERQAMDALDVANEAADRLGDNPG
ncbi:hypothetical protein A5633_03390 [Mycolicibacterium elephantis]|uniref:hypothetical protein n=1 Tax=Mycolicibacterium elephantis TaxID=81858 RepID=UPI0007E99631|nr:hypothetical protein [Mycolicibacterium elephantis]OBA65738.1 hypothetical protein A5633_03390 [Mycolicibacterium elephantis]